MNFATWVRQHREAIGLSQRQVCRKGKIMANLVSRIERGEIVRPRPEVLDGLARGLGLSRQSVHAAAGILPADIQAFLLKNEDALGIIREAIRSTP